jgi:hypothetical protein
MRKRNLLDHRIYVLERRVPSRSSERRSLTVVFMNTDRQPCGEIDIEFDMPARSNSGFRSRGNESK